MIGCGQCQFETAIFREARIRLFFSFFFFLEMLVTENNTFILIRNNT